MAEESNKPELLNILKTNKENGKMFNKGFNLLNKNIINSIKANISVGKSITTAVMNMTKMAQANGQDMLNGFKGLIDAEKEALAYDKQSDTADKLKAGEDAREGGKESLIGKLPKGKDLIDPKKWGDFAKGFVGSLFGMLTSLVTTILMPLAIGALKGYYGTIAKFFKAGFGAFGALLKAGVRAISFVGKLLGNFAKSTLLPKALEGAKIALTAIGDLVGKGFSSFLKFIKGTRVGMGFLAVIEDVKSIGSAISGGIGKLLTNVKDLFGKGIFATVDFFKGIPATIEESSIGKFVSRVKNFFSAKIFGAVDFVKGLPESFAETKAGQVISKIKNFFKLPIFVTMAEKVTFGVKSFAETSIGKLVEKVKGLFGIGAKAGGAFGAGLLDDMSDMGKGLKESALGKFFGKIKTFFGFGDTPGPFTRLINFFKKLFEFKLPEGISKTMGMIGKVFGKVFAIFGIFMGIYEAVKAFTTTEGTFGEKVVAALKAFIDEVVFGLPNFLIEMVGKGISGLLSFLGFGDSAKAVEDATKDFSIMDLITDSVGKVWAWMKGFFSDLFSFEDLSMDSLLPSFDFDFGNPLKIIGEKLSAVLAGGADIVGDIPFAGESLKKFFMGLSEKVGAWGMDEGKPASGDTLKSRSGGVIPGRLTGEQVPAILHANEIVLAEQSAKLFMQAAQMFAQPEYINSIKDLVKNNSDIKTQTTDAIMQAGAMSGGDGGTAQMIASIQQQTAMMSQTMAQIPGAVQEGANAGTMSGSSMGGFSKNLGNPHERKPK